MRIVLLSGGSGKRLWPLSNEIRSKAFLKLLPMENGGLESMLQRICRQLAQAGLLDSAVIVTHESQAEITRSQVGETLPLLTESYKRGTYPAIALAASYWHSVMKMPPEETICVMPVDSYVEEAFFDLLGQLPDVLRRSGAELALVGAAPRHSTNQYGYIVSGEIAGESYREVSQFVEKPDKETAASLIARGALWNCGVFAFPLSFMVNLLHQRGEPATCEEWLARYKTLNESSFDREVVEKTPSTLVMPYKGEWNDLGDWRVLPDFAGHQAAGLGERSPDSNTTFIINELDIPIRVIGAPALIVAASPDGILIAARDEAHRVKEMLPERVLPRQGEERWGTYRVLDDRRGGLADEVPTQTRRVEMRAGWHSGYRCHAGRREIWTILSGEGELAIGSGTRAIRQGDVLLIPEDTPHAIRAAAPLIYVEVQIVTGVGIEGARTHNGMTKQVGTKQEAENGNALQMEMTEGVMAASLSLDWPKLVALCCCK